MAVVKQVAFGQGKLERNDVETRKQGIFSNFSPNNGNQTTTGASVDPKAARLAKANLAESTVAKPANVQVVDETGNEWRVRISIHPNSKILYRDPQSSGNIPGLLSPLKGTDGFIFPYLPQVTVAHTANYASTSPTHSNYAQYFYESSTVASISISGDFTVQNLDEAKYFLAGIYFFRACTKMFYGNSDDYQGSPPPIVYLDGYGQHYLPHVPCVVTAFSHTMPNDVDYLEVNTPQSVTKKSTSSVTPGSAASGGVGINVFGTGKNPAAGEIVTETINTAFNRVPTFSTFSLTLQPVISRTQAITFDYSEFARGQALSNSTFSGGFL